MLFDTAAYALRVNAYDEAGKLLLADVPCKRFSGRWSINQIPTATLELAAGYDMDNGKPSNTYQFLDLPDGVIVEVLLYARGSNVAGGVWPEAPITLWYGPRVARGTDAQAGSSSAMVTLAGWPHLLTTASTVSSQFVAGGLDILDRFLDADTTGGTNELSSSLLVAAVAGADGGIFNGVLKNVFTAVMSSTADGGRVITGATNSVYNRIGQLTGVNLPDPNNDEALAALFGSGTYRFHNPREIPLTSPGGRSVHELGLVLTAGAAPLYAYLGQIVRAALSEIGSASTWDKLLLIANMMGFAVCPSIRSAAFVPRVPTYTSGVWRSVANATVLQRAVQAASTVPLGGIVLVGSPLQATNFRTNKREGAPDPANVMGAFIPGNRLSARMAFAPAPGWLVRDVTSTTAASQLNGRDARPDGSPYPDLGTSVAQMIWMDERFKSNTMTFTSPLRLDIMPGSCIKVVQTLKTAGALYGYVDTVGVTISAGKNPEGRTSFGVSHVRPATPVPGLLSVHPLYQTRWLGGPLVRVSSADLTAQSDASVASDTPGDTEVERVRPGDAVVAL
jgi:hypothetical protein